MNQKNDIEQNSKFYENKNARANCPDCDSLATCYYRNTLYCQNCKAEYFMKVLDKKKLAALLKTGSLLGFMGLVLYFIL